MMLITTLVVMDVVHSEYTYKFCAVLFSPRPNQDELWLKNSWKERTIMKFHMNSLLVTFPIFIRLPCGAWTVTSRSKAKARSPEVPQHGAPPGVESEAGMIAFVSCSLAVKWYNWVYKLRNFILLVYNLNLQFNRTHCIMHCLDCFFF